MRSTLAAFLVIAGSGHAVALDCEQLIKTHGFLSRAQFQCNYSKYSGSILAQAKECGQKINADRVKENLAAGMKLFDESEVERGHIKMCAQILRDFPSALSR